MFSLLKLWECATVISMLIIISLLLYSDVSQTKPNPSQNRTRWSVAGLMMPSCNACACLDKLIKSRGNILSNESRQDGSICQCLFTVWAQSRSPRATVTLSSNFMFTLMLTKLKHVKFAPLLKTSGCHVRCQTNKKKIVLTAWVIAHRVFIFEANGL